MAILFHLSWGRIIDADKYVIFSIIHEKLVIVFPQHLGNRAVHVSKRVYNNVGHCVLLDRGKGTADPSSPSLESMLWNVLVIMAPRTQVGFLLASGVQYVSRTQSASVLSIVFTVLSIMYSIWYLPEGMMIIVIF